MKTNKIIASGLAATAIIALSFGSASAMWGNGGGQGGNWGGSIGKMVTSEEKAKLQSMSENDRQEYMTELKTKYNVESSWEGKGQWSEWKKGDKEARGEHSTADMLADIEKQDVSAIEIDLLEKQYEEEMMANELYMSFYEMYGIDTFKNIAESEAKHMEAVKALLDRYDIETPTSYAHIQDLYDTLKEAGSKSAFDALEVWVKIEFVDIDDIITAIKATDNEDIKVVLTNIWGGSYNHLRGFLKAIDNNGYETELDWTPYLEETDLDIKWPIKYKLAEKLESEWVDLPEQVSSDNMKIQKGNDDHSDKGEWKKWEKNENANKWKWNNDSKNSWKGQWKNSSTFELYKKSVNSKYWSVINAMSNSRLEILIDNIDELLEKIDNSSDYSIESKEKYNYILWALKEIAQDKLDSEELDIEGLLK